MRVLLADDDPHVRSALRLLLENESGVLCVGDCDCADDLVDNLRCTHADVVLFDWDLPGLHVGNALNRLRAADPACRLVALSGRPEQRDAALHAGATSFVCKGDAPESLLGVLRELEAQSKASDEPERDTCRPEPFEIIQEGVQ